MERTIHDEIQILKNFVEGKISAGDFEQQIYTNHALEKLLSDAVINWHGTYLQNTNVFLYVCEQNFSTAAGVLNIHGAIQLFLSKTGEQALPSDKYADDYEIITGISPEYIDADPEFIKKHIVPADHTLSKADRKKYIRRRYSELFKYQSKPPHWIQNPEWPVKNEKPLFFLGQIEIKSPELFHDNGAVYLFIDTDTKDIETIKQFY
nr:hypothetical protein [uncultured Chryseobacterium sp.]